jgi:hypothetical protein
MDKEKATPINRDGLSIFAFFSSKDATIMR